MKDQEQPGLSHLPVEQGQWLLQGWPRHSLALPVVAGEAGNWD